jgi:GT2 family glycosyltransferase
MPPHVAIIVLNWNGLQDTRWCLDSLKNITYPDYEVLVLDNGSAGPEAAALEKEYPGFIHVMRNPFNAGFTGGNNLAIKWLNEHSKPDYFLLLNNDTEVHPDFLSELVNLAEREPSIGITGPKTYVRGLDNVLQTVWTTLDMRTGRTRLTGFLVTDTGQYNEPRQVDCLQGSCLLIKAEVIRRVGLLDEGYFCYFEENDYFCRARQAGYRIFYAPRALIWHENSVSIGLKPWYRTIFSRDRDRLRAAKTYYMTRNVFRLMRKNAAAGEYASFLLYYFGFWLWYRTAVILLYYRQPPVLGAFLKGVLHGLRGVPGPLPTPSP